MSTASVLIPPLRTNLNDPNSTDQTAKEWYLYWKNSGDRINRLNGMISYGAHAARPDPANAPDGALYVESDRSVIYSNIDGIWQYIAGTMWGTLNPDQRPTDLGTHDAGFDFRTTDDPAREFIWSQTEWIEATPVRYGTHAARLAVDVTKVIDQMLWVETDRGAIYQLQQSGSTHVWQYLAGTMWGTLSPDQRPADLGTHDAGFDFRGTDQQREFIWSQTVWVETTPVAGASNLTHPNVVTKVGSAGQIVEGGITDQSAGNSGAVQITATGQVGIGVAAPGMTLEVDPPNRGAAFNPADVTTWGDVIVHNRAPAAPNSAAGIALGISGPTAFNNAYSGMAAISASSTDYDAHLAFITRPPAAGAIEAMRITSVGRVAIGMTAPTYQFQLSADSGAKPGTSTWTVASDIRVKQNIAPVKDDSLAILNALNWVRYEYNGAADTPRGLKAIGLSAQELSAHLPEAVRSETGMLAIDYHHILVHAARAIQQLDAEVKRLRAMVEKAPI